MKKVIFIFVLIFGIYSCSSNQGVSATTQTQKDGSSYEKAIVIKAKNEMDGVKSEYAYISKLYPSYKLKSQGTGSKDNRNYDSISIITADGVEKTIYFDITNFYGKF